MASGRARAVGIPTRGTTSPNRLRRVDRWLLWALAEPLQRTRDPLVVDLGFGAAPVTTIELAQRVWAHHPSARVLGLEIDAARVAAANATPHPAQLEFRLGGFELDGVRPVVVRAMNVLRQYEESAVSPAWSTLCSTGAIVIDGTCDEIGRRACWLRIEDGRPRSLTLAAHLPSLRRPSELAERLPKSLIAHNVPGEQIHRLLSEFDAHWAAAAPFGVFGERQRWINAVEALLEGGWPVIGRRARWRLGEVTLSWPSAEG